MGEIEILRELIALSKDLRYLKVVVFDIENRIDHLILKVKELQNVQSNHRAS